MTLRLNSCPNDGPDRLYMDRLCRTIELWARALENSATPVLLPSITDTVDIGSSTLAWATLYLASGTNTTAGAAATINKSTGRFRVSAGTATFTLTNSRIAAGDTVIAQPCQSDATGRVTAVVPGSGSCTVSLTAPTANMDVQFLVVKV